VSRTIAIENYFAERFNDIEVLAANDTVINACTELGETYNASGENTSDPNYIVAMAKYAPFLDKYARIYGFFDLFVISKNGSVIYTVGKEADYGTNLVTGPYKDTALAEVFGVAVGRDIINVGDFEYYEPAGEPAIFMASPLKRGGEVIGAVALQLSSDQINAILTERTGLGESGEAYLVGSDLLMRSDSRFEKKSTILERTVNTKPTKDMAADETRSLTGKGIYSDYRGTNVIGYYSYVHIGPDITFLPREEHAANAQLSYYIISEMSASEALGPARTATIVGVIVGFAVMIIGIIVALVFSLVLTRPVRSLNGVMTRIVMGDYDARSEVKSGDELQTLGDSLNAMLGRLVALIQTEGERDRFPNL